MKTRYKCLNGVGRGLVLAAPVAAFGFLSAAEAQERVNVGMILSWPAYSLYALAIEKGLVPEGYDIRVTNFEDPLSAQSMLATGQIDILEGTMEYAPIALANSLPNKLVAFNSPSYGVDQIILAPGLAPEDVAGSRIAAPEAYIGQILMGMWLESAGISPGDVNWVNLNADEAVGPMISGDLAAAYLYEPWVSTLSSNLEGTTSIASSADPEFVSTGVLGDALYMNESFIEDRRAVALDMMQLRFDALQYWHDNTDEANQFFAEFLQWPVEDIESVMGTNGKFFEGGMFQLDFNEAARFCGSLEGEPPLGLAHAGMDDTVTLINDWWIKLGVLSEMNDASQITDCSIMTELADSGYRQSMDARE
jgi:NitT/TauT family transport system substrate-binding protein